MSELIGQTLYIYDDPGVTALSVSPPTMNEPLIDAASPAPIVSKTRWKWLKIFQTFKIIFDIISENNFHQSYAV